MTRAATLRRRTREVALTVGAVLGVLCAVTAVLALLLDLRVLAFRSGSMSPTVSTGSLAVARTVPAADLRVGDVVTVPTSSGSLVTHRIVQVTHHGGSASLELRGDANRTPDNEIYQVARADRMLFAVPRLGYAGSAVASPVGLFLLGLYAAVLLRILLPRTGSRRHRAAAVPVMAVVLLIAGLTGVLGSRSALTSAAWSDTVATTNSKLTTGFVSPPASFTCGAIGALSVTFNWTAVPGATSYYLHYGAGGGTVSTPITGTSRTITSLVSGGTAWVTANVNFGSTVWTSAPSNTRGYTVAVVSFCG